MIFAGNIEFSRKYQFLGYLRTPEELFQDGQKELLANFYDFDNFKHFV
jgi:hypothetical protein